MFQTQNRKLEQFLFCHDIFFSDTFRGEDGGTVWIYQDDPRLREVVAEWQDILEKRRQRKVNGVFVTPLPKPSC